MIQQTVKIRREDDCVRFVKEIKRDQFIRDVYISRELSLTPFQAEWLLEEIESERAEWLIWHRL